MANFHQLDDVAHIGIVVGIRNQHYTVCIISLFLSIFSPGSLSFIFIFDQRPVTLGNVILP